MEFLLDTNTFIWFINGDKLPEKVIEAVRNANNRCFISIASIWEIAIKSSLNKLELKSGFDKIIDFLIDNDIEVLPITLSNLQILTKLPFHHRDPFDRIIISQGISEELIIITNDEHFKKYPLKILW